MSTSLLLQSQNFYISHFGLGVVQLAFAWVIPSVGIRPNQTEVFILGGTTDYGLVHHREGSLPLIGQMCHLVGL